ncbi:MAG: lipid-A-disaccharide synthase [Proteobacteria bacterium]|nr:lipid-A-disaccharide synthase [Pseudomonadota bacterium]
MPAIKIGIVAGEASGDLLGSNLIAAIQQRIPHVTFIGICGPKMQALGAKTLYPMDWLSVRGYVEVLRNLKKILGIRKHLARYFLNNPPDLFIGIDAPDFNLALETRLKAKGIPVLHYVSPSIWAWRKERLDNMRRAVDHVLTLFPFEKPFYDEKGIAATYVGHPLADMLPLAEGMLQTRKKLRLDTESQVVAILPGSRLAEIDHLGPLFIKVMIRISEQLPQVQFLLPFINKETRQRFEEKIPHSGALPRMVLMFGHAHEAMTAANVVLLASGTASLEAALIGKPMVIAYKMPCLSWLLLRRKAYLPWVGLPNILANETLVPEFLQKAATPTAVSEAVLSYLKDAEKADKIKSRFIQIHQELRQDTANRAAGVVEKILSSKKKGHIAI